MSTDPAGAQVVLRVEHVKGCSCPLRVEAVERVPFAPAELAMRYQKVLDERCSVALVPSVDDIGLENLPASA